MSPPSASAILARRTSIASLSPKDRWLLWPVLAACTSAAFLQFISKWPGELSFSIILLSLVPTLIIAITICISGLILAAKRRVRQATSLIVALLFPIVIWQPVNWATDCIHLACTVGFGAGQLNSTARPIGNKFTVSDWSTGFAGGPSTFLIHDVTDEIALPTAQHKRPIALEDGFGEECDGKVRRLLGHYYICTF